jgi:hypothetical protein
MKEVDEQTDIQILRSMLLFFSLCAKTSKVSAIRQKQHERKQVNGEADKMSSISESEDKL